MQRSDGPEVTRAMLWAGAEELRKWGGGNFDPITWELDAKHLAERIFRAMLEAKDAPDPLLEDFRRGSGQLQEEPGIAVRRAGGAGEES